MSNSAWGTGPSRTDPATGIREPPRHASSTRPERRIGAARRVTLHPCTTAPSVMRGFVQTARPTGTPGPRSLGDSRSGGPRSRDEGFTSVKRTWAPCSSSGGCVPGPLSSGVLLRRSSQSEADGTRPPWIRARRRPCAMLNGCRNADDAIRHGLWRRLVARLTGGQEVVGSNPASPTR